MAEKVVLAYSGGLDTSVILKWLVETYGLEVIAFCADIGQGPDELEGLEEKARASGATEVIIRDLREEFARDYVLPVIKAAAVYEGSYLLGTAIARPLIAKGQVDTARALGATHVSHGATGKGNDQVRFELTYRALAPDLKIIAPWRDPKWTIAGRSDAMEYAHQHGIPIKHTPEKPWSTDRNLLHISYESGILEDPGREPPEEMFTLTVSPEAAPDEVTHIEIGFEHGLPVTVNDERLSSAVLLQQLNEIGGRNGIGRVDLVENRFVGMKSRGVYETPGGTILHVAHRAVESLTMDRDLLHLRDTLMPYYAERVYYGFWFSPEMRALNAFMDAAQENVTGTAHLKLYKGNVTVVGRTSPFSLYDEQLVTMDADAGAFDQSLSTGFIQLNALRLMAQARREQERPPR